MTKAADNLIDERRRLDAQIRASVAEPKCPVDAGAPLFPATVCGPRRAPDKFKRSDEYVLRG